MNRLLYLPLYLIAILPFPLVYFLSDCLYFLFYYILQYRKKIVRINLENSFPSLSPSELKTIEQEFYHHFCDVLFEAIKALTISKKKPSSNALKSLTPKCWKPFISKTGASCSTPHTWAIGSGSHSRPITHALQPQPFTSPYRIRT